MNTKTFKRILSSVVIGLVGLIFILFLGTCLNINPIKGLDLKEMNYNGYTAFFGKGSEFDTSVGSITVLILLLLVVILSILNIVFPKISLVFNIFVVIFALLASIFIFLGTTDFMVVRYSQSIDYFNYYCDVNLGWAAIIAGIFGLFIVIASIAQEVYAVLKR